MIERDGQFTWEENNMLGGIRQDVSESTRRFRNVQNCHVFNEGSVTKDLGIKPLNPTSIGSESLDILAGYDCHFSDGTQYLTVIGEGGSNADLYIYDNNSKAFTAQSRTIANNKRVDLLMFADKLHIIDGTEVQAMSSGKAFTSQDAAGTYADPCHFGTVYANRLILSGHPTYPFSFFPSGVRDSTDWDASLINSVTGSMGEKITCLGTMGSFLIVGGRTFTRAYYLGTASPKDWDWNEVSQMTGPTHHASFVSIPSIQGRTGMNVAFFWSNDGPMMLIQSANSPPTMINLSSPIIRSVRGVSHESVEGLAIERYDDVQGVYVPEFDEVRFAVTRKDSYSVGRRQHDELYCLNLTSAMMYAQGAQGVYPYWRIRNNTTQGADFPVNTIFSARMHPETHVPSTNGVVRCLCAQDGYVYEMDANGAFKDDIKGTEYNIPFFVRRDGYDGMEDGIRNNTKSARKIYTRATLTGDHELYVRLIADGGSKSTNATIDLSGNLNVWGSRSWGDGSVWNAGEFVNARGHVGTLGKKYDVEFYDNGNIEGDFQINSFSILGYVEDRR